MNRPTGYWLKRLDASLEYHLDATLGRLGLSRRQWQVLDVLRSGPATPAEIGAALRPFNAGTGSAGQERDMAALVRKNVMFLLDGRLALTPLLLILRPGGRA